VYALKVFGLLAQTVASEVPLNTVIDQRGLEHEGSDIAPEESLGDQWKC
jgi:hypothetical protein